MSYGQFCPIAKATEVLGERWMLLIIRELFLGSHRYTELQRGLSRISPSLLTKRLKQLENAGIVVRKTRRNGKAYEYYLTPAGKELQPLVEQLAIWGMRWARGQLSEDVLDVEFLMWDIQRRINTQYLPKGESILCFIFKDLTEHKSWWLVIRDDYVDLCTDSPGTDVDLYILCSVQTLVEIWEGDITLARAVDKNLLEFQGQRDLSKSMSDWLGINPYSHVRPGDPSMRYIASED
ncbi:MAG: winged helix-turn-helix transcriptional regulator [Aestuariibacter sp.]